MKFAVISDIHANQHALQAVWEDIENQSPDLVYCLGDLVGYGAFPNEVIEFIRDRDISTVRGNYDEGVGFDMDDCGCAYKTVEEDRLGKLSLLWTRQRTTAENKAFLQELPLQIRLEGRRPYILLVHGSPRKINEYLYQDRPKASFERIAKLAGTDVLLFGHTHLPYTKTINSTLFVNAGSVGKSKDGDPRGSYAILNTGGRTKVEIRRVRYDVSAAADAIRETDLPDHFADLIETGGVALLET
ncbi:MAG TPA: metallophosphoesterase family protein [Anaerolineae bacterium]|nr:metallophosphoesterase family protein [Anaerolineae bacterium]